MRLAAAVGMVILVITDRMKIHREMAKAMETAMEELETYLLPYTYNFRLVLASDTAQPLIGSVVTTPTITEDFSTAGVSCCVIVYLPLLVSCKLLKRLIWLDVWKRSS